MSAWLEMIAWIAWSVLSALALRLALGWAFRRLLHWDWIDAALLAYPAMGVVFVGSLMLHGAVLGPAQMYGATAREAFSLTAYVLAPFGLPLLVGGWLVLIGDLGRMAVASFRKTARP